MESSKLWYYRSFTDIEAVSGVVAWAVGYNGAIIRTTNSGVSWSNISTINTLNYDLYTIEVIGNNIWVGGDNLMWRSIDNGINWEVVQSNYGKIINKIQFVDPMNGWYVRSKDSNYNEREMFETNDGGSNWTKISSLPVGTFSYFPDFVFADQNRGWVLDFDDIQQYYIVFKTVDGGNTWDRDELKYAIYPGSTGGVWRAQISLYDENIWVSSQGWLHHLVNGNKWFALQTNSDFPNKMKFLNSQIGWIIDFGILRKTFNGGKSWHTQGESSNSIFGALDIDMVNSNTGWVVKNSGEIYYTITGGE